MTVQELIEHLRAVPQDLGVVVDLGADGRSNRLGIRGVHLPSGDSTEVTGPLVIIDAVIDEPAKPKRRRNRGWVVDADAKYVSAAPQDGLRRDLCLDCGALRFAIQSERDVADRLQQSVHALADASSSLFTLGLRYAPEPLAQSERALGPRPLRSQVRYVTSVRILDANVDCPDDGRLPRIVIRAVVAEHDGGLARDIRSGDPIRLLIKYPHDETCHRCAKDTVVGLQALAQAN